MCGIVGFVSPHPPSSLMLQDMCDALRHRGPDDQGFFVDANTGVYLGFNRLSIVDLTLRARQPFFSEDKTVVALVNGEIYNFRSLREELKNLGHIFCSDSDSEVVVHAYEQWHENFVRHLKGMFAIVVFDTKEDKILLVRDRIGIKPLYYLQTDKIFVFASEAKAFLRLDHRFYTPELNSKAVDTLLLFPFIIDDDTTILKSVKKIPPGHMLVFKNHEIHLKKYWELTYEAQERSLSFEEASEHFEEKIKEVVQAHLQSDVPVGIFLSGGVDSSFLAAIVSRVSSNSITALSAHFDHPLDERKYAQRVSKHLGLTQMSFQINPAEAMHNIENIISSFDDLSCIDGGLITNTLLAKEAKNAGFKVILNGEGADEIFGGYPWFALSALPFSIFPDNFRNSLYYSRISKNLTHYCTHRGRKKFNMLIRNLNEKDSFRRQSKFEICYQLPNNFLMKLDKATMAHGVETRVPYLDHELVQFVYNLPISFKRAKGRTKDKRILREVAGRYLPQDIAYREKRGFLLPIDQVLKKNEVKIKDYLFQSGSIARRLLAKNQVEALFNFKGLSIFSKEKEALLWKLFILEVWRSQFLKNSSPHIPDSVLVKK